MQWAALILLILLLAAGTVAAWARTGRLPAAWQHAWERRRPALLPAPGLRVLDRVTLSPQASLLYIEVADGTRLTVVVGAEATILHREPPAPPNA
jgi:hypothetical protein